MRIITPLAIALLAATGCTLDFARCGEDGVRCEGTHSWCVCATGKCAEEDHRCESGLHYIGGRCVSETEAESAVVSTTDIEGVCPASGTDGGTDTRDADARDADIGDTDARDTPLE